MSRVHGVMRAGYYAWRSRGRSNQDQESSTLARRIRAVHRASHGIRAPVATLRYTSPGMRRYYARVANRQFDLSPERPDHAWVGDITYLKVGASYRYLAVVMDRCSRRILGWSYGSRKDVRLTLKALNRAFCNRCPRAGVVFHTDRGIEYGTGAFKERLAELGFTQSMNRPGKVTDNSYIESYFRSMELELFDR